MQDSFKYKGMRRQLVRELNEKGIKDKRVLDAFEAIPRHFFLDNAFAEQAYTNMPFQIGSGQTISHPYTVAFQTELLDIQKGDKILEIGSGSGFQTCMLCEMGAKVYSIERHKELHLKAQRMVRKLNYIARMSFGDGYKGLPTFAPFDKIIITCGAPNIPQDLLDQLKIGGIMVIPVGEGAEQQMKLVTKTSNEDYSVQDLGVFSFVPMLENKVK
ncbi:MAG: protein-L-isoaspartate(D-aspartate) O-methyltransferase [Crocinitomicaceae bacterium]|nr:protein-L-isoaspartate(D-aspartate) O-methyltransferase [Crocinitomicaceae bacterium]MDG1658638.1 protein-L-isoaspartate(D-aspartate) O-methyltransferase [Crocinitomicaceae bacterium]MDG2440934.1 protein-L-isoaspartate(D-aspartate) O-methyltransferase [Crocinitomicaceae bacterium]